jgi:membrane associated rhomboid family serine protease
MAFFQDTRPRREPFLNAPPTVLWLIAALVAAHLARILAPMSRDLLIEFALIPARYTPSVLEQHGFAAASLAEQILPVVTYTFLHADFMHLGINSLWLLAFGPAVARRIGAWRFLLFFFLCAVGAAAIHIAVNWGALIPVVGASGAVAGLMAAGIRILYGARRDFTRAAPLAPVFGRPVLVFTAIWAVINVVVGLTGLGLTNGIDLIAWEAHLGGYFTGLFLIGVLDRPRTPRLVHVR